MFRKPAFPKDLPTHLLVPSTRPSFYLRSVLHPRRAIQVKAIQVKVASGVIQGVKNRNFQNILKLMGIPNPNPNHNHNLKPLGPLYKVMNGSIFHFPFSMPIIIWPAFDIRRRPIVCIFKGPWSCYSHCHSPFADGLQSLCLVNFVISFCFHFSSRPKHEKEWQHSRPKMVAAWIHQFWWDQSTHQ